MTTLTDQTRDDLLFAEEKSINSTDEEFFCDDLSEEEFLVQLKDFQIPHFEKIKNRFQDSHVIVDNSPTGAGKTLIQLALAEYYGLELLVIAPLAGKEMWLEKMKRYEIPGKFISYGQLRSKIRHQPKHGYLTRKDETVQTTGKGKTKTETVTTFQVTDKFKQKCFSQEGGILLVVDESHNIKNESCDQSTSVRALTQYLATSGSPSRCSFLSATPFDQSKHSVNILKLLGYITKETLYDRNAVVNGLDTGIGELIERCRLIEKGLPVAERKTNKITKNCSSYTRKNVIELCYQLYVEVIQRFISFSMQRPESKFKHDVKNGYYNLDTKEQEEAMKQAIEQLKNITKYDYKKKTVIKGRLAEMKKVEITIEKGKIPIFTRKARQNLTEDKYCKVLLFVNYLKHLEQLEENLQEFNPMILRGSVDKKERDQIARKFQTDDSCRLIIAIPRVAKECINLQPLKENRPVFVYRSPNYNATEDVQSNGRVHRLGKRSATSTRIVYAKAGGALESGILKAMLRKTQVLSKVMGHRGDIVLPGNYPDEIED